MEEFKGDFSVYISTYLTETTYIYTMTVFVYLVLIEMC